MMVCDTLSFLSVMVCDLFSSLSMAVWGGEGGGQANSTLILHHSLSDRVSQKEKSNTVNIVSTA